MNDASVEAEDMELKVGESGVINYTTAPEGLKVNFVADNSGIVSVDEDGTVKALKNGTAKITINVGDDEVYAKNSTVITVTVTLNDASVEAEDMELNVSDSGVIKYTTNPKGLDVTFVADNSGVVSVDEKGTVKALKEGKANITVKVGDDKVYAKNSTVITITVSKIPTEINVNNHTLDLGVDDKVDSVAELLPSDAGKLNFTSSDEKVVVVDDNGTFTAVGVGSANVTVSFDGNNKFEAAESKIIYVTVSKIPTKIFVSNDTIDMKVDDEVDSGVSITPYDAGKLNFISSDVSVVRVDDNGTFTGVGIGTAVVTVSFDGNYKFEPAKSKNITVTVTKIPTEIVVVNSTVDMHVDDEVDPGISITPFGAGELDYVSSDVSVVRVDGNGTFIGVGTGNATVTVRFLGNEKYSAAENKTIGVTVTLNDARIIAKDMNIVIGENATISYSTVPAGLNVTFVADNSGVVSVSNAGVVTALKTGVAKITILTGDNKKYALNSTTVTVNVNKIPTEIAASNIATVFNVKKNIVITLKDGNGKPISGASLTVDLNGAKTYTTDANGQVNVSTKKSVPKTYTAKITFNGNSIYDKSSKNVKVTLKKGTPKITAKTKKFKVATKVKKYTITLKNNLNKAMTKSVVYLKVAGKTYKAKANSQGKVTFKITKLNKKGTFKATITYKGNTYYNKVTKKATIKVVA